MKRGCSHRWRDKWAGHAGLRLISDIRGAAAVEFAMILWPLMLLVLGTVDGGRMMWTQNSLQYAVEQAARYAALNKAACSMGPTICYTPAQIQSYAASMDYGMSLSASDFASARRAVEQIQRRFRGLLPLLSAFPVPAQRDPYRQLLPADVMTKPAASFR